MAKKLKKGEFKFNSKTACILKALGIAEGIQACVYEGKGISTPALATLSGCIQENLNEALGITTDHNLGFKSSMAEELDALIGDE